MAGLTGLKGACLAMGVHRQRRFGHAGAQPLHARCHRGRTLDINAVARTVEYCTQLPIHPRHPYVGDRVFTCVFGFAPRCYQKAFAAQKPDALWNVPYMPIDPADVGRSYDSVIRINSQSGKGGIAYLLESRLTASSCLAGCRWSSPASRKSTPTRMAAS